MSRVFPASLGCEGGDERYTKIVSKIVQESEGIEWCICNNIFSPLILSSRFCYFLLEWTSVGYISYPFLVLFLTSSGISSGRFCHYSVCNIQRDRNCRNFLHNFLYTEDSDSFTLWSCGSFRMKGKKKKESNSLEGRIAISKGRTRNENRQKAWLLQKG